jgi:hypothetical protein
VDCAVLAWLPSLSVIVVIVGRWRDLLRWICRPWLEGVVDVVLDQTTIFEHMLHRDLVVGARCIKELLEMILRRTSLGWAVLGPCRLALDRCDEVVITPSLVALLLLLLLEARGRPLAMVHDLLPLALRGVECHRDCLLAVRMIACDVKELPSGTGMRRPNRWIREVEVMPF